MSIIIATFENGSLMSSQADGFFRYHDGEATEVDWDGEDGGPLGYFTLRRVERDVIARYVSEHGDPWASMTKNLAPGWYVDVRGEDGTVWAFQYGGHCEEHDDLCTDTHAEELARADYNSALRQHIAWADEVL